MQLILDPNLPEEAKLNTVGVDLITSRRQSSDAVIAAEISKSSFGDDKSVASWRRISRSDIPQSREFREAWTDTGAGEIRQDISKCRKIHRDRIREARKPLLDSLDTEYQIADEQDNKARKREVAQKKQRLRDATDDPRIEAAQTVEELKAVWPLNEEESPGKKGNKKP
jgi:hypothetical protein